MYETMDRNQETRKILWILIAVLFVIALLLLVALICLQNPMIRNEEKLATADDVLAAFTAGGYNLLDEGPFDAMYMGMGEGIPKGLKVGKIYVFDRLHWGEKAESVMICYLEFKDESSAISFYNQAPNRIRMLPQQSGEDFNKAVYHAKVSDGSIYGETIILSRINNVIIFMYADWDNYKDGELIYDFKATNILEGLGF